MNNVPMKAYNGLSVLELRLQLLEETDITNVNDIARLLNTYLLKKDLIRKSELDSTLDLILLLIVKRFTEKGDCFSNKDLLDYFKVLNDAINRIDVTSTNQPSISITENNVNITNQSLTDALGLSRDDKKQVLERFRLLVDEAKLSALDSRLNNTDILQGEFKEVDGLHSSLLD